MANVAPLDGFRPMLAASLPSGDNEDLKKLDFSQGGFICSPKMDGIRAVVHPMLGLISRTLKPIRNRWIQQEVMKAGNWCYHMDGELVVGEADDNTDFNTNQSAIMSAEGQPKFTFNVFDIVMEQKAFDHRVLHLMDKFKDGNCDVFRMVKHQICSSVDEILEYEEQQLAKGYEGIIIRHPKQWYKNNRSTFRQQGMIKLKRFTDAEAEIIGFEELERNQNEAYTDALGYTKRSGHKANQIAAGTLGKVRLRGVNGRFAGTEFFCGSGFDMPTRDRIWNARSSYLGKLVKYKFQDHGSKDAPRSPIFLGFRHEDDM